MKDRKRISGLSTISLIMLMGALLKFVLHLYMAPGYGFFFDELYTNALSRHLAFGYVDLPPLTPGLVALSRILFGDSLFASHVFPALAGAGSLAFACLITREFGGKAFATALTALGFIIVPGWLMVDSIFCYDSIDQLILAAFLFFVVRLLKTENPRLWIVLGLLAGAACLTKMTILSLGPGFLIALLLSKQRKDLATPWPWLGAGLCLVLVSPYLLWQQANGWPTLDYWKFYGSTRVYKADLGQYLTNVLVYMSWFLLPFWLGGLYRLFRPLKGRNYFFFGVLFLVSLGIQYSLHSTARMILELFIPPLAAGSVWIEEITENRSWTKWARAPIVVYLLAAGLINASFSLPLLPIEKVSEITRPYKTLYESLREFNGSNNSPPIFLAGRVGWEDLAHEVSEVYHAIPEEKRQETGIFAENYAAAGAVDQYAEKYALPNAVSGMLTYYLWGPGENWEPMIVLTAQSNSASYFFNDCELKSSVPVLVLGTKPVSIYLCEGLKTPKEEIWKSAKSLY